MTIMDLILGNFDEESPEREFSKILNKDYESKFSAEDFDTKFSNVAGYKPIKTNAVNIAKNYLQFDDMLSNSDKEYVIKEFIKAYDDVADKDSIDIRAIIDGIVDEIADTDDADDEDEYDDIIDEKDEDFDESDSDDEDYD